MKTCIMCKENLSLDIFRHYGPDKRYVNSFCKPCMKIYKRAYTLSPVNRERERARSRKFKAENREYIARYNKEYRKKNPSKSVEHNMKRQRGVGQATPAWLSKIQREEMDYIYTLAKEITSMVGEPYHVDHAVPLKGKNVCGLHVPWNLQVLPADINLSKNNKFDDWSK